MLGGRTKTRLGHLAAHHSDNVVCSSSFSIIAESAKTSTCSPPSIEGETNAPTCRSSNLKLTHGNVWLGGAPAIVTSSIVTIYVGRSSTSASHDFPFHDTRTCDSIDHTMRIEVFPGVGADGQSFGVLEDAQLEHSDHTLTITGAGASSLRFMIERRAQAAGFERNFTVPVFTLATSDEVFCECQIIGVVGSVRVHFTSRRPRAT